MREPEESNRLTRRDFMQFSMVVPVSIAMASGRSMGQEASPPVLPWYRRTFRWGQTNINEKDPTRYDIAWWRDHWKRTRVQGLVINAGGIVAYYPSKLPLHYQPPTLEGRDLFGELTRAAHQDGIVVLARMDSNRAHEDFYKAHPDWFAVREDGTPYKAGDLFISCINSPYYEEHIPRVLKEVIDREHPEGFTDNSWSGLSRDQICFCVNCSRKFRDWSGQPLPVQKNWDDPVYRQWIQWNYKRRLEVWDLFNRVAREAGGEHCLWIGMIGGNMVWQSQNFRDYKEICSRAEMIMFDDQGRSNSWGFQGNGEMGKRIHGLLGWEKVMPESMAMYQRSPTFRKAANPEPEARMWMIEGFAGTIQPWWHHVGAYQEDRRQFTTAEKIYSWYEKHEEYLVNRRPLAEVAVVYSQMNTDFYGRDEAEDLVVAPYKGVNQALIRSRIPYLPLHIDHISRESDRFKLLILPNVAALSNDQVSSVRAFVDRGGSLLCTGETGHYNEWGDRRDVPAFAAQLGYEAGGSSLGPGRLSSMEHTYLRLSPDVGKDVYGPRAGDEPEKSGARHPVLAGFDGTNILPFGGRIELVKALEGGVVPLTLVPEFPIYPPETSWMREPRSTIPALILGESDNGGRTAYFSADIDRRFALYNLPDHGDLLENVLRWCLARQGVLKVKGPGLLDCHLYTQERRTILHIVNLTSAGTWKAPVHELIPVGPIEVSLEIGSGVRKGTARSLVGGAEVETQVENGRVSFQLASILDHEVLVVE